jgi:type III pantothenate kinase
MHNNSGLRIALLDLNNQAIQTTMRITWKHMLGEEEQSPIGDGHSKRDTSRLVSSAEPSNERASRYRPDQADWLSLVDEYVSQTAGAANVIWLVSSVRRDALKQLTSYVADRNADQLQLITRSHVELDVDVLYPDRVGIDRLLAASAAAELFRERPLIVMQVGSAMTVDLVVAPKVFRGGAILPGVPMMLRLLGQAADMLPTIDADEIMELPALPGRDTEQAMRCGTASALVGGAQHLAARYRNMHGPNTLAVISGGDGLRLSQHIDPPVKVVPHLVLQGLIPIASRLQHTNL